MSSMNLFSSQFDSVDSALNYLREPLHPEVVSSTTTSSVVGSIKVNNGLKSTKKQKKEKELANFMNTSPTETLQILSSGRVRYGPITVNPRKKPSKTLFTGRRSKYEVLDGDEAEKRRLRRDRNRVAATKCREKRENVLSNLEMELNKEVNKYTHLIKVIQQLEQRKQDLQSRVSNQVVNGPSQQTTMLPAFYPSMMETQPAQFPRHELQIVANNEEEFSRFLQPSTSILTNSGYNTDQSNQLFIPEQQSQQQTMVMNTSSLDRLINSLQSPAYIDNNNNNCSGLFNSVYGSSSCTQQHSSFMDGNSLPPTQSNSYVR